MRATVNLRVDLRIDESYVPDMNQRLMLYRKVAAARQRGGDRPRARGGGRSLRSAARFGAEPGRLRPHPRHGRSARHRDASTAKAATVVLKFRPQAKVDPVRLVALVRQRPDLTLVPPAALKLNLDGADGARARGTGRPSTPSPKPPAPSPRKGDRPARERGAQLVDGARPGRRGDARVHEGGDPPARQGRSAGARRHVRAGRRPVERAAAIRV